jgi:hypothetical protein
MSALVLLGCTFALTSSVASAHLGIASFTTSTSSSQAGAHSDFSSSFTLAADDLGNPDGQLRKAAVELPPGLVGNPQAIARCPIATLQKLACGPESQIGMLSLTAVQCKGVSMQLEAPAEAGATTLTVANADAFCPEEVGGAITIGTGASAEKAWVYSVLDSTTLELAAPLASAHSAGEPVTHIGNTASGSFPLFNVQPSPGHVATFAASLLLAEVVVQVDVGEDGRLTATISEASTLLPLTAASLTLWGVPADPSHDADRCGEILVSKCGPTTVEPAPFITYPSSCAGPLEAHLSVSSWQGENASGTASLPAPTDCEALTIDPHLNVAASTGRRDTPAGYEVALNVPQNEEPYGLATPEPKEVSVSLPEGVSLSPALANGLQTCAQSQLVAAGCPDSSKIGAARIVSPLLEQPLEGGVYMGDPTPAEKYRLFVKVSSGRVAITLYGHVQVDEHSGRATAVFENVPQLPFESLKVDFFGGAAAALANPVTCGPVVSSARLASYAGQTVEASSTSTIDEDSEGGPCPPSSPFAPGFAAGSSNPQAGIFTPFGLTVSRADGQQDLSTFTATLPPGLVGKLASVPLCPEPAAGQGTCPQASEVGSATVAVGAGPSPVSVSGPVYLTGPYGGAPFGLSVAIRANVGPFELGTSVLRSRISLDPADLHLTIASDPLPQIIGGIPLRTRSVHLEIDRAGFIANPTSCKSRKITATIDSTQGVVAERSSPFRVLGCLGLPFAPRVTATTDGAGQLRGHGASLDVKVTMPAGTQSNVRAATIRLPAHLLARLTTIRQACTVARFAAGGPAACPAGARVGSATVSSPTVSGPLTGPVYVVSHGSKALPEMIVLLRGQGISLSLHGALDFSRAGTISATFGAIPDVPISTFTLDLPEGPHSVLVANQNLCTHKLSLSVAATAQNGAVVNRTTRLLATGCRRRHVSGAARRAHGRKPHHRQQRRRGHA